MHVVFVSKTNPGPSLGGGPRRTHQVLHELREFFGALNVTLITSEEIIPHVEPVRSLLDRLITRWKNWSAAPFQSLAGDRYGIRDFSADARRRYRETVQSHADAELCVLEGARLAPLVAVNNQLGLKTVLAPWSFESLTDNLTYLVSAFQATNPSNAAEMRVRAAFASFADDTILSAGITRTWLLSRLENAFLKASGLECGYLPYYPIGEAEECLRAIRRQRCVERGLFVICGGSNAQNLIAMQAFLQRLSKQDLPAGSRIAIAGCTELPGDWTSHLGECIQFPGRLPEDEFDSLLARAQAVLVPQTCGFGCMTRVADMLCAGIPVLADALVANGTGEVPGAIFVTDAPGAWSAALNESLNLPEVFPEADFTAWHQAQRAAVRREFARVAAA